MKRTKELLTDTFWELLEEKAYSKITVNDIVICNIREISELSFLYGTGVYKKKKGNASFISFS